MASSPVQIAPAAAGPAGDGAADGQQEDQPGPGPGVIQDQPQRGSLARPRERGVTDRAEVGLAADQERGRKDRRGHDQQRPAAPERGPPAMSGQRDEERQRRHEQVKQGGGVVRGIGYREGEAGGDHPAGGVAAGAAVDGAPGGEGDQQDGRGVVGGEGAEVQGGAGDGEQGGGEERGAAAEEPCGGGPGQGGGAEHEGQGQDAGAGQAAGAVGQGAEGRVEDGGAGEVGRERGDGGAVQQVGPFAVPGPQVQRLALEGGVGVDEAQGQGGLDDQDRGQRHPGPRQQPAAAAARSPARRPPPPPRGRADPARGLRRWSRAARRARRSGGNAVPARCRARLCRNSSLGLPACFGQGIARGIHDCPP